MPQPVATKAGAIFVSYDGLQAANHRIDMRRFGYAIVGLDHVVTYGVVALLERRIAKPRERLDFAVVVGEPKAGSVGFAGELMAAYQGVQANLPFLIQMVNDKVPDLIWYWVSFVLKKLGGRDKEAADLMEKMLDMMDKVHEREKLDRQAERDFIYKVVDRLAPHAAQMAVPVGEAANVFRLTKSDGETTEIGVPEAAAIRSKEPIEVGDPQQIFVKIDAITKHSNRGAVELPDNPGRYVAAEFRDPLFETRPNPYTAAMDSGDLIEVTAVPSLRAGELHRLYIMALAAKA